MKRFASYVSDLQTKYCKWMQMKVIEENCYHNKLLLVFINLFIAVKFIIIANMVMVSNFHMNTNSRKSKNKVGKPKCNSIRPFMLHKVNTYLLGDCMDFVRIYSSNQSCTHSKIESKSRSDIKTHIDIDIDFQFILYVLIFWKRSELNYSILYIEHWPSIAKVNKFYRNSTTSFYLLASWISLEIKNHCLFKLGIERQTIFIILFVCVWWNVPYRRFLMVKLYNIHTHTHRANLEFRLNGLIIKNVIFMYIYRWSISKQKEQTLCQFSVNSILSMDWFIWLYYFGIFRVNVTRYDYVHFMWSIKSESVRV